MSLPACTIVQVQGATPSTSLHLGVVKFVPDAGARSVSYRIRGVGIVPTTNGMTLGYAREEAVLAYHPEDCRIVVFGNDDLRQDDRNDVARQLEARGICGEGRR
jgi:hypothetical protein